MIRWSNFKNFSEAEFACRGYALGLCDCGGRADMDLDYMERLQGVRDAYRRPMVVNSGFRCPDYDKAIGGAGVHPTGHAADIAASGEDGFLLLTIAVVLDMRGIGLKQHGPLAGRYMHLDDLGGRTRPRVWTYG